MNIFFSFNFAFVLLFTSSLYANAGGGSCVLPTELGSYTEHSRYNDFVLSGNYLYLAAGVDGFVVLDVSDPSAPARIGGFASQYEAKWIRLGVGEEASLGYFFTKNAADGNYYFLKMDLSNPASPVQLARYPLGTGVRDVALDGGTLCAALGANGMSFHNALTGGYLGWYVTDHPWGGDVNDVEFSNGIAYASYIAIGMELVDASDPTNPTLASTTLQLFNHHIVGNRLYASHPFNFTIFVVDISDPTSPIALNEFWDFPGLPAIHVQGDIVYVSDETGMYSEVYDFKDPTAPLLLGSYKGAGYVREVSGDQAYLWTTDQGVRIVDVTNQCTVCAADINGDGVLNFFDVSVFLGAFGAADPAADFTGDGLYNFFDVSAFLSTFGARCP